MVGGIGKMPGGGIKAGAASGFMMGRTGDILGALFNVSGRKEGVNSCCVWSTLVHFGDGAFDRVHEGGLSRFDIIFFLSESGNLY